MAAKLGNMDSVDLGRLRNLIERAGLPVAAPRIAASDMRAAMGMDKKVHAKQLRFVLLRSLGEAHVTTEYDDALLERILGAAT